MTSTIRITNKSIFSFLSFLIFVISVQFLPGVCSANNFSGRLKSVSITDSAGKSIPPTAVMKYTQNENSFTFDASKSIDSNSVITAYKWNFGDGTTGTGQKITHNYAKPGNYPVTLAVVDALTGVSITQSNVVPSFAVVMEDAESLNSDGTTKGAFAYGPKTGNPLITNVFDSARNSHVLQLTDADDGRDGCKLLNPDGTYWNYSDSFVIDWSMKTTGNFYVFVLVQTSAGNRYLTYVGSDSNKLGSGTYIYHGLGAKAKDGTWHSYRRDLKADLLDAQPDIKILSVKAFLFRAKSMSIDDVKFIK